MKCLLQRSVENRLSTKMDEFGRSFSIDSLGDSTRSLLSPLYRSSPEPYLSEGPLESSDEELKTKGSDVDYKYNHGRPNARSTESAKTSSPRNLTAYSQDSSFASSNGGSKSSARRRKTTNFRRSSPKPHSSRRSFSDLDSRPSNNDVNNDGLSSWEEWLVRKTLQDREKAKTERLQRKKEKEEMERKQKADEDKAKKVAENHTAWIEAKNRVEVERRRMKKDEELFEKRTKEERKQLTDLKSKENYTRWCHEKREQTLEASRKDQEDARLLKDIKIEHKLKNEQAFDDWLLKTKERPKPVHGSFGYTCGKLTGFYEWGSYPAPGFVNPVPWVPPKVGRNKDRRKVRQEMQPPSPPLLFKELEQRISQRKKDNSNSKGRNMGRNNVQERK